MASYKIWMKLLTWIRTAAASAVILFPGTAAAVSDPAWWTAGTPSVIDASAASNNHGVATIGQTKWMIHEALSKLDTSALTVSQSIRSDLVGIVDLTVPTTPTQEWRDKQKAPILNGQIKALAKPFYDRLHASYPTWLDHESTVESERGQLQLNGTKDHSATGSDNYYPWTPASEDDANFAPATIGQLKALFALRFESLSTGNNPPVDPPIIIDPPEDPPEDPPVDEPVTVHIVTHYAFGGGIRPVTIDYYDYDGWDGSDLVETYDQVDADYIKGVLDDHPYPDSPLASDGVFSNEYEIANIPSYSHVLQSISNCTIVDDFEHSDILEARVWVSAPMSTAKQVFKFDVLWERLETNSDGGVINTSGSGGMVEMEIKAGDTVSGPYDIKAMVEVRGGWSVYTTNRLVPHNND